MISNGYIAVPESLFDDPVYRVLTPAMQIFLIDLYRRSGDCKRFTIDYKTGMKKITMLVRTGLINVCERRKTMVGRGAPARIYEFRHSVASAYE